MFVLNPLLCFIAVAFKNHSCNKIADGYGNHGNGKMPGLVDGILPEGELLLQVCLYGQVAGYLFPDVPPLNAKIHSIFIPPF